MLGIYFFSLFCHMCLDSPVYRMLDCVVLVAPAQSGEMGQLNKPCHSIKSAVSLYYETMQIHVPVCGYNINVFLFSIDWFEIWVKEK